MLPSAFPPFRPRPPWLGPDLQTLRNALVAPRADLRRYPSTRLTLPLGDGSGDALSALLQHPGSRDDRPLVVLIHGLSGTEDSAYMIASAAAHLERGYPVLRLNLRGAGASRPLCRLQYHAGRSADLRAALAGLDPSLRARGLLLVGYSLGGNMLLKFLAEHDGTLPIRAAAAVSAPIDLAAAARRILMPRNRVYHWNLLHYMKLESLGVGAEVNDAERRAILAARTIVEFDDHFVAPRNRFAGAAEYYAVNSGARFLPAIAVPTLVVHALDDPWIPPDAYQTFAWREQPHLTPLLTRNGGHVGFHAHDSREAWHDRCVAMFFANR